jgi:hypothetical protein
MGFNYTCSKGWDTIAITDEIPQRRTHLGYIIVSSDTQVDELEIYCHWTNVKNALRRKVYISNLVEDKLTKER